MVCKEWRHLHDAGVKEAIKSLKSLVMLDVLEHFHKEWIGSVSAFDVLQHGVVTLNTEAQVWGLSHQLSEHRVRVMLSCCM